MNLDEILKLVNWKQSDITRLYYGKSHCCRCGCGGTYHDRGTPGFKRYINQLLRGVELAHPFQKDDIDAGCYVNIDLAFTNDRCICLYNN